MKELLFLVFFTVTAITFSQNENLAQKLGYKKDAKLLIIHGDDIGMSHSVTASSFEGFKNSSINSGSIMVPCPWLIEVSDYSRKNPEFDLGLHLTLTAEWKNYKWKGVSSSNEIPSLINEFNQFYDNTTDIYLNAKPEQVRKEIQAQIDLSRKVGLKPSHIDSHMGALFVNKELFKVYLEVGDKNKLVSYIPPRVQKFFDKEFTIPDYAILVDDFYMLYPISDKKFVEENVGINEAKNILVNKYNLDEWIERYSSKINSLKSGLTVILVHLGYNDDELKAITIDHPDFGSKWRQLDFEAMNSNQIKSLIKKNDIKLVTWRQIQKTIY
jgi:predicted glycoside hydrolase/deacetylase ChbG (UPF0249 family)